MALITDAKARSVSRGGPAVPHGGVTGLTLLPSATQRGQGKWVLRRVLDRHVPRALIERPKRGFDPPIGAWLRGPLRAWAGDLLDSRRLEAQGWLDPGPIRSRWDEHQQGTRNWDYDLWTVLQLQSWLDAG